MADDRDQYQALAHRYRNESAKCRAMGRVAIIQNVREEFESLAAVYEKMAIEAEQMNHARLRLS
jgi:predicted ATPase